MQSLFASGRMCGYPPRPNGRRPHGVPKVRIFPWGDNDQTKELCNFNLNVKDTTPVGRYPKGASPYGLLDMAGNVWEWTSSLWGTEAGKSDFGYPYRADDGRENQDAPDAVLRTLRGGSWFYNVQDVRCAVRVRAQSAR